MNHNNLNNKKSAYQVSNIIKQTPEKKSPKQLPPSKPTSPRKENSLDTVRDILFGAQVEKTERQQAELKHKLNNSVDLLKKETQQNFIAVSQDIETIKNELQNKTDQCNKELNITQINIEKLTDKFKKLDEKIDNIDSALRILIKKEATIVNDKIQSLQHTLTQKMNEADNELAHTKADRNTLAQLFKQIAIELDNEN